MSFSSPLLPFSVIGTHAERALLLSVLVISAACTPGNGTGAVNGQLFISNCSGTHDSVECLTGSAASCVSPGGSSDPYAQIRCVVEETRCSQFAFDLEPQFFAGEPIEDISTEGRQFNRLKVLIQRLGKRPEYDDSLFFDITDQFEVARCVRGRVDANGVPDWDTSGCSNENGTVFVKVGSGNFVNAYVRLVNSCAESDVIGTPTAQSEYVRGQTWVRSPTDSWVVFSQFGSAAQPSLAPADRDPVPLDFKVLYGDHLDGSQFQLQIEDQYVVTALLLRDQWHGPIPTSRINGTVMGEFHFDLQRSASAQAFP